MWPFTIVAACLLLASVLVWFRIVPWDVIAGLAAFIFLSLAVARGVVDEARRSYPGLIRQRTSRAVSWLLVITAVGLIVTESFFLLKPGKQSAPPVESPPAVAPEEVIYFAGTLDFLPRRQELDLSTTLPVVRAGVDQPVDKTISFTAPTTGEFRLAVQMTDSPFVDQAQRTHDALSIVGRGRTVGQTFLVSENVTKLTGVRVKLEARSIPNNLPGTSPPDAPLVATLFPLFRSGEPVKVVEARLPPKEAGLNDRWRWVTFPFEMDLLGARDRKFAVEFTSSSDVVGWALTHVNQGFEGTDDFYAGGELSFNRAPNDPSGDLAFEVLGRNERSAAPELIVDATILTLEKVEGDEHWFLSQPITLREGQGHTLIVRSTNPHISFYRFVFVQEQSPL